MMVRRIIRPEVKDKLQVRVRCECRCTLARARVSLSLSRTQEINQSGLITAVIAALNSLGLNIHAQGVERALAVGPRPRSLREGLVSLCGVQGTSTFVMSPRNDDGDCCPVSGLCPGCKTAWCGAVRRRRPVGARTAAYDARA